MMEKKKGQETLLLKQPTISEKEIVFLYAGDLWIVPRDGTSPRRLTAQKGAKSSPHFSPDGEWVAFSANYDGNQSVYVISREGGSPKRLTYHPYPDNVRGWTPDGKQVLFASNLNVPYQRSTRLFTVPLEGGMPSQLPMDMADRGSYSPDGKTLAYTRYYEAFWTWKRYRGGMTMPIWLLDLSSYEYVEIPHHNASDTFPAWLEGSVYFLSDRNHTMNVYRYDVTSKEVEQVTFHDDFDVRSLNAGGGTLVYEQGGRVHLYDLATRKSTALSYSISADLPATRPHYKSAVGDISNCGLSPSGQRAIFEAHGDLFTVPAKKGDIRNLTQTKDVCERYPAWSPDGQSIAYFSDASGEYDLVITDQKGVQKTVIPLNKQTFFYTPIWSPDSKKIAFTDKALNLYYLNVETKELNHVDSDTYDNPVRSLDPAWSPDSQWLTYTRRLDNQIRAVFLYELQSAKAHQVTDGMSDTTHACFSRDGKYLFFTASTNYGLNTGWLDMSSFERPILRSLYVTVLNDEDPSPLSPESDDEAPAEEKDKKEEEASKGEEKEEKEDEKKDEKKEGPPQVKIVLEGIDQRILSLPLPARQYSNLQAAEGKLFFLEMLPNQNFGEGGSFAFALNSYDIKERKSDVFVDRVSDYWVSANGKKLLYSLPRLPKFAIVDVDKKPSPEDGVLKLDKLQIAVDPIAEWKQIFREAYRIQRDFFYDAEMHGLDWAAAYQKYLPLLEHVGHRDDLNYLIAELSGELVCGHIFVGMGDIPGVRPLPVGLLGADYEITAEGYYRIKHIIPGLNWHPELRSPLTEPGVNVKEGEYILAVNGQSLRAPMNIYNLFENTAEKVTDVTVGSTTDAAEARTVSVTPLGNEQMLRHWDWVESNRKKVDALSNGRVAYVYMPDTAVGGYTNFNRYYFSQLDKQAVVLDERFNGGGMVADYVIDLLNRPLLSYWATREGKEFVSPNASIFGPKAMIINELAGSGGDAMPNFFRRRKLGKLVGKRTWGGLVGIYDYPTLMDGGFYTAPRMAIYSPDGRWEVENEGVPPDIEVEMTPSLTIAGHDPQLEKAVEVVLEELQANPPIKTPRPAPIKRV
jgi:tricorn protease